MNKKVEVYQIFTKPSAQKEQEEAFKENIKKSGYAIFSSITDHLFYTTCPPKEFKRVDAEKILSSWAKMEEK